MDPERAAYLKAIEQRFLELRGRGLMLSPRDVMLVDQWRERGVPTRVVLGAIEAGVERYLETHPHEASIPSSLAYFAGHVDRAVNERQELLIEDQADGSTWGREPTTRDEAGEAAKAEAQRQRLLKAIAAAGRQQSSETAREALRYAWRRLVKPTDVNLWEQASDVDRDLVDMLAACLVDEWKTALELAVTAAVEEAGGGLMGAAAKVDVARGATDEWVREHFGVPDLLEVLIERGV